MKKVSIAVIALFFMACSDQELILSEDKFPHNSLEEYKLSNEDISFLSKYANQNRSLSKEEAISKTINSNIGIIKTRSSDIKVTNVDILRKMDFHYADSISNFLPDTLAYFISTDDGLCTVIPKDYRVKTTILAQIPQEQIYSISNETDNNIKDMLINMFANTIVSEISEYESMKDSLTDIIFKKIRYQQSFMNTTRSLDDPGTIFDPNDYDFLEVYGPVINTYVNYNASSMIPLYWHQDMPYNLFVRNKLSCGTVPTGCNALAAAMIMAYWKYPNTVEGLNVNWNNITAQSCFSECDSLNANAVNLANLLKIIGEGINTTYDCNLSTANPENTRDWLLNHGYEGGALSNFDYSKVTLSLNNNRPVLIYGYMTNYYSGGHTWIVDGFKEIHSQQELTIYAIHKITGNQIVYYNGTIYSHDYFLSNNFGSNNAESWISTTNYNSWNFQSGPYSFNYHINIFTDIRPQ